MHIAYWSKPWVFLTLFAVRQVCSVSLNISAQSLQIIWCPGPGAGWAQHCTASWLWWHCVNIREEEIIWKLKNASSLSINMWLLLKVKMLQKLGWGRLIFPSLASGLTQYFDFLISSGRSGEYCCSVSRKCDARQLSCSVRKIAYLLSVNIIIAFFINTFLAHGKVLKISL